MVQEGVRQFAWLLVGASLLGMLARWIRTPYAVLLVIGGLLAEASRLVSLPRLDPTVLLFVLLPPLLFDASFRADAREFVRLLQPILLLAVPGTILTAAVVGGLVSPLVGLPLGTALLFGAIVAATDPVAVISVFHSLGLKGRLPVIVEGESLVNDGVAITLYTVLVGIALGGEVKPLDGLVLFVREVGGGVVIGVVLGFAFSRLTALIDDHLVEMTLSAGLAYGSYLLAQTVEASGALAVVAAGLVHGEYGRRVGMSENTRRLLDDLWEFLGFVANAMIFLLVGFGVNPAALVGQGWAVAAAILAVLVARVLAIGLPSVLIPSQRLVTTPRERLVIGWGGLRGALTIALALALPPQTPQRDLIVVMAYGVVLFTLVVQGLSLPVLIRALGLGEPAQGATRGRAARTP